MGGEERSEESGRECCFIGHVHSSFHSTSIVEFGYVEFQTKDNRHLFRATGSTNAHRRWKLKDACVRRLRRVRAKVDGFPRNSAATLGIVIEREH